MAWRLGGFLLIAGLALDLTLSGPFIVLGFVSMLAGVLVLAIQLEASMVAPEYQIGAPPAPDLEEPASRVAA